MPQPAQPIRFSVVIPTFERRDLAILAVRSALAQTYQPEEVVLVDDGSNDGTAAAVAEAFNSDPRVVVVGLVANGGACRARNAGIERATCKWIAFLDSDDSWAPDKLAHQARALAAMPDATCCFVGIQAVKNGKPAYVLIPPTDVVARDLYCENVLGSTSGLVASREALLRVGGFDPDLPACQDWDLYLRLLRDGQAAVVPLALVAFDEGEHPRISGSLSRIKQGHAALFAKVQTSLRESSDLGRVRARHLLWTHLIEIARGESVMLPLLRGLGVLASHPSPDVAKGYVRLLAKAGWRLRGTVSRLRRRHAPAGP